jgi:CspA family cold shock protein
MEVGKIKKLTDREFGFIAATDGAEVFFHRSECQSVEFDALNEGQVVTFDRESDTKGPRARNVRPKTST